MAKLILAFRLKRKSETHWCCQGCVLGKQIMFSEEANKPVIKGINCNAPFFVIRNVCMCVCGGGRGLARKVHLPTFRVCILYVSVTLLTWQATLAL